MQGRFITFEGGEGAGKSTQIKALEAFLQANGITTLCTREPGGTPMAEALRDLVVTGSTDRWSPLEEMLIMYTARSELVRTLIRPALEKGIWVLADRFADSTTVYQGYAGGVALSRIEQLHQIVLGAFVPDLTLILDISAKSGLHRVKSRAEIVSRFEQRNADYYDKIRKGYLQIAKDQPNRCVVVDGAKPIEELSDAIAKIVQDRFRHELAQ